MENLFLTVIATLIVAIAIVSYKLIKTQNNLEKQIENLKYVYNRDK
jgi:hypothetical protein